MLYHWHSSSSYSVSCAGALLPAHWAVLELPGWVAFADIAGRAGRAVLASAAGTLAAYRKTEMNIPGMMAIAMGTAAAPGMLAASVECCPYSVPLSYFYILA